MAITQTNWEKLLSPDSQIPPDVFFLVKGEDEGNASSEPIGAHRIFLAGVSPFFMGMLFGPMKETREVIEVWEAFKSIFWKNLGIWPNQVDPPPPPKLGPPKLKKKIDVYFAF